MTELYSGSEKWEGISRNDTRLPYLTIRHPEIVGVNDLSCLKHTEQSTSVTEIVV